MKIPKYNTMLNQHEIREFRKHFKDIDSFINYQWGGYSSKPIPVLQEVQQWQNLEGILPSSKEFHVSLTAMKSRFRTEIARFINCGASEISLTEHTTAGINFVAWGIPLDPGDRIIISKHEHPSNILPWYNLTRRFGCEVLLLEAYQQDDRMLGQLEAFLKQGRCKIISLSHISRNTGYRLPVRDIASLAHKHGAFFLVDGAQSAGSIPVDVQEIGCDAYALCGHKWMFGPQGTGALFVNEKSWDKLLPSWIGSKSQISYDLNGQVEWKHDMSRNEYGTSATTLFAGWLKALELLEKLAWEEIFSTISERTLLFKQSLRDVFGNIVVTPFEPEHASGIFCLELGEGNSGLEFAEFAWQRARVQVSSLENPSQIRICNHFVNTVEEQERFIAVLQEYVNRR